MTEDEEGGSDRLLPHLEDLDPEEALRAFMEVDPEKVKERLEGDGDSGLDEG